MSAGRYTRGTTWGPWRVQQYLGPIQGTDRIVHLYLCTCIKCNNERVLRHDVLGRADVERRAGCAECRLRKYVTLDGITKTKGEWVKQICKEHHCNKKTAHAKLTRMRTVGTYVPVGGLVIRPSISDEWKAALCKPWRHQCRGLIPYFQLSSCVLASSRARKF